MNNNTRMDSYLHSYVSQVDDNAEQRMLSNKFMMDLSERIPTDWEKLGIELEVGSEKMDELRDKCTTDVSCWAMKMFFRWTELFEGNIQLLDLIEGLENIRRYDLASVVKEAFNGESELRECTQELQTVFHKLSTKLSADWYRLGIELEVPTDDLETIKIGSAPAREINPAFEMLKYWNNGKHVCPYRLEELKDGLRECRRNDVIRWIEEKQGDIQYVFRRVRSARLRSSVGQDVSSQFESLQVSENPVASHLDCVDQDCPYTRLSDSGITSIQQPVPQEYTSNQRLEPEEDYDEIDNACRTPSENDENTSGHYSQQTHEPLLRLDSISEDGNKNIDLPGGLNEPKILTGKISMDSIQGEHSVDPDSYAQSTTSC